MVALRSSRQLNSRVNMIAAHLILMRRPQESRLNPTLRRNVVIHARVIMLLTPIVKVIKLRRELLYKGPLFLKSRRSRHTDVLLIIMVQTLL